MNFDERIDKNILEDPELNFFLDRYISNKGEKILFIKDCLKKDQKRKILLRLQWYAETADRMEMIRRGRPALQITFLMAMAEAIMAGKKENNNLPSKQAIKDFFLGVDLRDQKVLEFGIKLSLNDIEEPYLTLPKIIDIMYEVRNRVVHGKDYWNFLMPDKKDVREGFTLVTRGWIGKRGKKKEISLDVRIAYEELRDVFIRTGLNHIRSIL
ncbi:MAG: hypothetical protein WD000_08205 [Thermodesulfobacteriota bacterium]